MEVVLPIITGAACAVSLFLLFRDMEKWDEDKQQELPAGVMEKGTSALTWIYCITAILITVAISIVFPKLYPINPVWVNVKRMVLLSVLWPLAYIDYKTYRIPNLFVIYGLVCRGVILIFEVFLSNPSVWQSLLSEAVAAAALLGAALLCVLVVKNGIGFGDMKLFLVMGLLLGLEAVWGAIFLALIVSFFIALFLLITKKKTRKDAIPFGPALVIGTYLSVFLSGM